MRRILWLPLVALAFLPQACGGRDDGATRDAAPEGDTPLLDGAAEHGGADRENIDESVDRAPVREGVAIDTVAGGHDTYRAQLADIVPLGETNFVVEYRDATDQVKVLGADAGGVLGRPEIVAQGGRWVRADASDGFTRDDPSCPAAVHVNTAAIEHGGETPLVRLDVHSDCAGVRSMVPVPIASGGRPSAVTVADDAGAPVHTLVVYGRRSILFGRVVRHGLTDADAPAVGDEFSIATFTLGSAFSTDVIYNRHSNRFIVGFIQRGGFGCSVWNVVLDAASDPPAVVRGPMQFGQCDGDQGGHHTSVAYNPRGDGTYAWWRQDMTLGKSVFIHDASGALTSIAGLVTANVIEFGNIWTTPVTWSTRSELPYLALFGEPEVHLFGMDGAGVWTDRVSRFGPAVQTAVRALPNAVVGLVRVPDDDHFGTSTLRLLTTPLAEVR